MVKKEIKPIKKVGWYYPFGLKHKGYNNVISSNGNSVANKFGYNGVELEESLGLDLYETFARGYDPATGRFIQIDPLGELIQQIDKTPYNFAWNNPVFFNDPSGFCPECPDGVDGDTYVSKGGGSYIHQDGSWIRDDGALDEVVIVAPRSEESQIEISGVEGQKADLGIAIPIGLVATETVATSATISVAVPSAATIISAVGILLPPAALIYISYQDPTPPLYMPESGPISTILRYQTRPTILPMLLPPPPSTVPTAEEMLLVSAYINQMAEHEKNQRESNRGKHEKGQSRKGRDAGGEKGDSGRRPPRKKPPGHKGPWPPKNN